MGVHNLKTITIQGAARAAHPKIYVLDTNVLVHDPSAIFNFSDSLIAIATTVLEELDVLKRENTERGKNTRTAIKLLDELRNSGSLPHGVLLGNGSMLKVFLAPKEHDYETPFRGSLDDNAILYTASLLKDQGYHVCFVSRDINARVKADVLGLEAQDYLVEPILQEQPTHELYKGWITIATPAIELKKEIPAVLQDLGADRTLFVNQFVQVTSQHNPYNYRIFRYKGGAEFSPVSDQLLSWGIGARNPQQAMALDLLLDDSIQLVNLIGPAGTGKTFLALLAGLYKVLVQDEYKRMLIARPVVPLGRDIGYLPGTIEEKLRSWMLPIYDNASLIINSMIGKLNVDEKAAARERRRSGNHRNGDRRNHRNGDRDRRGNRKNNHSSRDQSEEHRDCTRPLTLDRLIEADLMSLEAITYMRGRSIAHQYILIDEVQNLTVHEVKTLISRAGHGSKIILAGDPYQIDIPTLNERTNGLMVTNDRFKGQNIFGSVYLQTSERGKLSQLAEELL